MRNFRFKVISTPSVTKPCRVLSTPSCAVSKSFLDTIKKCDTFPKKSGCCKKTKKKDYCFPAEKSVPNNFAGRCFLLKRIISEMSTEKCPFMQLHSKWNFRQEWILFRVSHTKRSGQLLQPITYEEQSQVSCPPSEGPVNQFLLIHRNPITCCAQTRCPACSCRKCCNEPPAPTPKCQVRPLKPPCCCPPKNR